MWISKLDIDILGRAGIYTRKWYRNVNGQKYDALDYKPFSTDFAFTRFLVPALSLYDGWALFCDCDFLFTADLGELFSLADPHYAVYCVKHRHVPLESEKMDGVAQTRYYRKNWSSLVLWNCQHPANGLLTLDCVNKMPGQWLHAFSWLKDGQIGELPHDWNHLVGYDTVPAETPRGIHFTSGIPTMEGYEDGDYADLWLEERDRSLSRFTEARS
jgi:lipopolysaccharide biosynthesis glycosyltransferase